MNDLFNKIRRVLRKPPRFIYERICYEIKAESGRFWEPYLPQFITSSFLLRKFKKHTIEELWNDLASKPYCTNCESLDKTTYESLTGDTTQRIIKEASDALKNEVDLLGSGPISLGEAIDWSLDYKVSFAWPKRYFRSISYADLGKPNDVKFPWELSRMQWMIPLGQAYLLTQDEKYAQKVKDLILSWIQENPYACSVNWACTMDVALRLIVWTWFFHVFKESASWADPTFRSDFLRSLYLHGLFTSRHLEKSDVNGNHYTADAAGLVFAGLFFGHDAWHHQGWSILENEIKLQIFEDGVDFEASIPYHRLVQELFFFPALYRMKQGFEISDFYKDRLLKMAYFTAHYARLDGSAPVWGDADDARVLPFGEQDLNDHRYLIGLIGTTFSSKDLLSLWSGSNTEMLWVFGETLPLRDKPKIHLVSKSFPDGGFYVMRDQHNHVFIDCGPLGLKGRGGHGHNDILSFEAILEHTPLIVDPGAYVYTSDYIERNRFRSTAYHNTPQIDDEEINRFVRPDYMWTFHHDAHPLVEQWKEGKKESIFRGSHTGYKRLAEPVRPIRTIKLNHGISELTIEDYFEGQGNHKILIPFHFHPFVIPERQGVNKILLKTKKDVFQLCWESDASWDVALEATRISPSYGVVEKSTKLLFLYDGLMGIDLKVKLSKVTQ